MFLPQRLFNERSDIDSEVMTAMSLASLERSIKRPTDIIDRSV